MMGDKSAHVNRFMNGLNGLTTENSLPNNILRRTSTKTPNAEHENTTAILAEFGMLLLSLPTLTLLFGWKKLILDGKLLAGNNGRNPKRYGTRRKHPWEARSNNQSLHPKSNCCWERFHFFCGTAFFCVCGRVSTVDLAGVAHGKVRPTGMAGRVGPLRRKSVNTKAQQAIFCWRSLFNI